MRTEVTKMQEEMKGLEKLKVKEARLSEQATKIQELQNELTGHKKEHEMEMKASVNITKREYYLGKWLMG